MSTEEWHRVEEIFHAALAQAPSERDRFLLAACRDDEALRRMVESLLASHEQAEGFLETPAFMADEGLAGDGPDEDSSTAALIGRRVAGYLVKSRIATGGMGVVYLAEQENPRRNVALKVMRSDLISPRTLRRFEREGQVLGRLQHPGIAQIFEAGAADTGEGSQPFFAMELVSGRPLVAHADAAGLDARERVALFARICDAVHHAHENGIIHRDLKPANILVDRSGQPKVLDFGIAQVSDSDLRTTSMPAATGQVPGTLAYMSPEQIAGDASRLDHRTDIYSLGVLCYELLAGRLPYDVREKTIEDAVRIITNEEALPLGSVKSVLGGDLEAIVAKALRKDPKRRYRTAADLARELRRSLTDGPPGARGVGLHRAIPALVAEHPAVAVLAGAAFGVVAGLAIAASVRIGRLARERDRTDAALLRDLGGLMKNDDLGGSLALVAGALMKQGRPEDAEPLLRKSLDIRTRAAPGDPVAIAEAEGALGACLVDLGRYGEAEPFLVRSHAALNAAGTGTDRRRTEAAQRLVDLYTRWGKPNEAEGYRSAIHPQGDARTSVSPPD